MNRLALLYFLLNVSSAFMTIVRPGLYSTTYKKSCLEIKKSAPHALSGLYDILLDNTVLTVYCEMAKDGGGYTFIPREAVQRGKFQNLVRQLRTDPYRVLLRFQKKDGLQPFTLITQLPKNGKQKLGVLMHNYAGYTKPRNSALGDYIYLGLLPASLARNNDIQGFRSNAKNVVFKNCDKNPNSYFAFFPNHKEVKPSGYGQWPVYEIRGVAVDWRKAGIASYGHRQLPNNFIFLTEIHFGGCGCYTSSDRWRDAMGTAIGFR